MKSQAYLRRFLTALVLPALFICTLRPGIAAPTNVFFTQFEISEGYSTVPDLAGQNFWQRDGSGGNGVVSNYISGQGQQAYIGYGKPNTGDDQLVLWRPINFDPLVAGLPLVKFSVLMNIIDSQANTNYDNFRWSVYNQQVNRLFSLDFDNKYQDVNYLIDGTNSLFLTGIPFTNGANYTLTVIMNFASNLWSATLNQVIIATNQPITTVNAPLNLGDIDAVWLIRTNGHPGNNYMLFDNYRITAEALTVVPVPPAQMQFLGRTGDGWALLRVFGQNGSRWSLDATTNFVNWTALTTNPVSGTYFDHIDTTASPFSRRFYRARLVP